MNPNNTDADNTPSNEPFVASNDVPATDASATPSPIPNPSADDQPVGTPSPVPAEAPASEEVATPTPIPAVEDNAATTATATPSPVPEAAPAATPSFATAAAPTATTATGPQGSNGSNKKMAKRVAIIVGVLIGLAVGALLYFMLATVTKEDYAEASRQFDKVSLANSALGSDISSMGYRTDDDTSARFDESVKEAEESVEKLKTENEALSKLKAVKVGEGATLYNTFNDKLSTYITYSKDTLTSAKTLRPVLVVCANISKAEDDTARVAAIKECSAAYGNIKDVPMPEFKTLVEAMKTGYADYATKYEAMTAIENPYGDNYEQYKSIRDELYAAQDRITDATKKFSSDSKDREKNVSVKESADALQKFLRENEA